MDWFKDWVFNEQGFTSSLLNSKTKQQRIDDFLDEILKARRSKLRQLQRKISKELKSDLKELEQIEQPNKKELEAIEGIRSYLGIKPSKRQKKP